MSCRTLVKTAGEVTTDRLQRRPNWSLWDLDMSRDDLFRHVWQSILATPMVLSVDEFGILKGSFESTANSVHPAS